MSLLRSYRRGGKYVARRYREWPFWLTTGCLALVAGFIAWVSYVPGLNPLVSLWIGAATPLILTRLSVTPLKDTD